MKRQFRRLGLAFAVSVAGLTATLIWYYAGLPKRARGDARDAVATLTESTDEVQRRETTRVIWESISLNDDLFTGEAIRTSTRARAKIHLKSGVVISLDPDSLVVLDQNEKGLALDFLEGNLFVQGASSGQGAVTLKTGQGEVSLAAADVSVSKGAAGDVDLEVFRGRAELNQGGRTTSLGQDKAATLSRAGIAQRESLRLTSPKAGENVLLDFAGGERLRLAWGKLGPGYRVRVAVGPSRGQLSDAGVEFAGDAGSATLTLKPGKWFVRLSARAAGETELASLATPFELAPRAAPAPLEPAPDQTLDPRESAHFRWLNRHGFQQQVFEIASNARFVDARREKLGGAVDHLELKLAEGAYFWRVTGYPENSARGLASVPRRVRISAAVEDRTTLLSPANHHRLTAANARNVRFSWRGAPGSLVVRDEAQRVIFQGEHASLADEVPTLAPGTYRWTVGQAEPFELIVAETPRLAWTNDAVTSEYGGATPTLSAAWRAVAAASEYRYRVAGESEDLALAEWRTSRQPDLRHAVPADGVYKIEAEALDQNHATLAVATPRTFIVKRRAPLAAPAWPGATAGFRSDARGNARLEWTAVAGAESYVLSLTDQGGHVTKKTFGRGPASLNRLKPGKYQIKVQGVDEFRRAGEQSAPRTLDVPDASDIRAPKIKAMKVR